MTLLQTISGEVTVSGSHSGKNKQTTVDQARITVPDNLDSALFKQAIDSARDGVSISDARLPDMPLIYVNPAFESMTGYSSEDILGLNCRFLQGKDHRQTGVAKLRKSLAENENCIVTLRNYTREGKLFHNELSMSAVHDYSGELTHFIGIQKDVTRRVEAEQRLHSRDRELQSLNKKLEILARRDALTNLMNRRSFDECLDREWRRSLRDGGVLTVFMIDIDYFKKINDRYGHAVGDTSLQYVARVLEKNFRRGTDYIGRYGGEEFIVLDASDDPQKAANHGHELLKAMRTCQIPGLEDPLTVSIGMCSVEPAADKTISATLKAADTALYTAKDTGRDRLVVASNIE